MNILTTEKFFFESCYNDVRNICKPLFENTPIKYFDYFRLFKKDSSRIALASKPEWMHFCYQLPYSTITNFQIPPSLLSHGVFSWTSLSMLLPNKYARLHDEKLSDQRNHFNIANGIAIIEDYKNYTDYYNFAGNAEDYFLIDYYFYNRDILERFILYFKDAADALIKKSMEHKIKTPSLILHSQLENQDLFCKRKSFIKQTQLKSFHLSGKNILLSKREAECLSYFAQGYTIKCTANLLNISSRTAEKHLNRIKEKLGLFSKTSLLTTFSNDDIINNFKTYFCQNKEIIS